MNNETQQIIFNFFKYSFEQIDYKYQNLTQSEKLIFKDEETFNRVLQDVQPKEQKTTA